MNKGALVVAALAAVGIGIAATSKKPVAKKPATSPQGTGKVGVTTAPKPSFNPNAVANAASGVLAPFLVDPTTGKTIFKNDPNVGDPNLPATGVESAVPDNPGAFTAGDLANIANGVDPNANAPGNWTDPGLGNSVNSLPASGSSDDPSTSNESDNPGWLDAFTSQ